MIHLQNLRGLGPRQVFGYFRDRWINGMLKVSRLVPVRSF